MKMLIRNMKSTRCVTFVKNELLRLNIPFNNIDIGEVDLKYELTDSKYKDLDIGLRLYEMEIYVDKNDILINNIKEAIHTLIYEEAELNRQTNSEYISDKVKCSYNILSNVFHRILGITIKKYIINERIEYVKELLISSQKSVVDIAFKLNYNSVGHLYMQFKKINHMTPLQYRMNNMNY
jgi:AraC family transcriptional regulator